MTKKYFASLLDACNAVAVEPVSEFSLVPNRWIRGNTLRPNGKSDASFLMFSDGQGGIVKNFQTGDSAVWHYKSTEHSTIYEQKKTVKNLRHEQAMKYENVANKAGNFYDNLPTALDHAYLRNKRVLATETIKIATINQYEQALNTSAFGLKGSLLVLPMFHFELLDGRLQLCLRTLQLIDEAGTKRFLKGGALKGSFWLSRKDYEAWVELKPVFVIGEGMATVLSVTQNSMHNSVGVAVGGCHNLLPVAQHLKSFFSSSDFAILGDVGNGERQARVAANSIGAELFIPSFDLDDIEIFQQAHNGNKPSDWNDVYEILELHHD
jgi:putative DNA primase/helicase